MAKKRLSTMHFLDRNHPDYPANKALVKMTVLDLQAAVITRGINFEDVVELDHGRMADWFIKNYNTKQNRELLAEFDSWMDKQLKDRGHKKSNPIRKYRRFSSILADGETKTTTKASRKAGMGKKKKEKRSRDTEFNIFKGTKKEETYRLAKSLYESKRADYPTNTIKELQKNYASVLVAKVIKKFPEAQEKSIKIWLKRALDGLHGQKK